MRAVGIDRTVLVTDLGRTDAVDPVTSRTELDLMARQTPARMLDLDDEV